MTRANKALVIMVVASLGLWGCARGPSAGNQADRLKALEATNARLSDDCRAASAAREQLRQRVQALEAQYAHAQQQADKLEPLTRERNTLRQQLDVRTSERDAVQAQFEQFRKGIRNLLGQAEASAPTSAAQPVTSAAVMSTSGKS